MSIKSMAAEIAQAILDDIDDERFVREQNGEIKVCASALFPSGSGFNRTVEGRRQRLCNCLTGILVPHGWKKSGWNRFSKSLTSGG